MYCSVGRRTRPIIRCIRLSAATTERTSEWTLDSAGTLSVQNATYLESGGMYVGLAAGGSGTLNLNAGGIVQTNWITSGAGLGA